MQFRLPELGEGVHEGELVQWKVKSGENVAYDQPLCEIMTDKATVEIPSAFKGVVAHFHAKEGEVVKVGQLLISFEGSETKESEDSSFPKESAAAEKKGNDNKTQLTSPMSVSSSVSHSISGHVLAAPSTRRLAREMGVDLSKISGSGPNSRVMKEDVLQFSQGHASSQINPLPSSSPGDQRMPFKGLRKKIAEKMRLSKDKAAHFTYVEEADVSELVLLRARAKELGAKQGIKVTYLPFLMKAMVAALKSYPILNSSLDEEANELVYKGEVHISLSVQTEDGLMAPVIRDVAKKSVFDLAKEIQEMVERARSKKLTREDLQGGTITLTNAGSIGGLFTTPVINFPEVAILGFNKIFRKPVVKMKNGKEEICIADWTYFAMTLDHRIVDGAIAAEFMKVFVQYVENPSLLVLA